MNLIKKIPLIIFTLFLFAGCTSEAEKEKNDLKIFKEQYASYIKVFVNENTLSDEFIDMDMDMDINQSEEELNQKLEQMKQEKIKSIDKEFKDIKSKIGKDIVNLMKEYTNNEIEIYKLQIMRFKGKTDENHSDFVSLFDSPLYDKSIELINKQDELITELYNRVHQGDTEK